VNTNLEYTRHGHSTSRAKAERIPNAVEGMRLFTFRSGGIVFDSESQAVDFWYSLLEGAARTCAHRADGHRHVIDFLLPGDLFRGRMAHSNNILHLYQVRVEAISARTIVARYPGDSLEILAESDSALSRALRDAVLDAVARVQFRSITLGHTTAIEKIAAFLLDMTSRLVPEKDDTLALPMSRYDIADYLGMAVETVSRTLTQLRCQGVIRLHGARGVQLVQRPTLELLRMGGAAAHLLPGHLS
jgi:CRP/FNR family transcriptional regulator, nitrogen fixation regulation protein